MLTTKEVLSSTGISYPMLTRLKELGIIARPTLQGRGAGGGRGIVGLFQDDVIENINWVKLQQSNGLSMVQIANKWRLGLSPSSPPEDAEKAKAEAERKKALEDEEVRLAAQKAKEEDRLLRVKEVAQRLAYSYNQTRVLIGKGGIPYIKIGSKGVRVRKSDLDAYIANMGRDKPVKEGTERKPVDKREPFKGRKSYYKGETS